MTTKLEQALIDIEGRLSEESYERWRKWAHEYEARPDQEGDRATLAATPGLPFVSRRGVWVGVLGGLAIWGVLLALAWWWSQ